MNFNEKLKRFTETPYFIVLMGLVTFVCWAFDLLIVGIAIFEVVFVYCMIAFKDTSPVLPLLILCTFMISKRLLASDYMPLIYAAAPAILISMILYFVLHRPKLRGGKFTFGLLSASLALLLGGIGFDYRAENILSVVGFCLLIVFVYVFFYSTAGEKLKDTVLNSFIAVAVILLLQIMVYYLRQDDVLQSLIRKSITAGWGISNNIAFVLSMLLPVIFYKALSSKIFIPFLVLACLDFLGIIFTMSRGNIIIGGVFLIFGLIYSLIRTNNKKGYMLALGISLAIVVALEIILRDYLKVVLDWLMQVKLDPRGREDLVVEAWEAFKFNPSFGIGFYHMHADIPHWFHNSILQILASTGIVGTILFIPFFYQRYAVAVKRFNLCNFMMISSIVLSGLYALIDCNFFLTYNLIFIMLEYIIIEREKDTFNLFDAVKARLFKREKAAA